MRREKRPVTLKKWCPESSCIFSNMWPTFKDDPLPEVVGKTRPVWASQHSIMRFLQRRYRPMPRDLTTDGPGVPRNDQEEQPSMLLFLQLSSDLWGLGNENITPKSHEEGPNYGSAGPHKTASPDNGSLIFTLLLLLLSRFSCVWLCATLETAAHQAPPSLGFSRQEYWSGLPFPSPTHESEKWKWSHSVVSDSRT